MIPAPGPTVDFARRHLRDAPVLLLHADAPHPFAPAEEGHARGAFAPMLTRHAALIPTLMALHDALPDGAVAVVSDFVWQTAPTPELVRAFAPAPGREKVRPVEGYEMQADHAGFEIAEKLALPRAAWLDALGAEQRQAAEADARGALQLVAWALRRR